MANLRGVASAILITHQLQGKYWQLLHWKFFQKCNNVSCFKRGTNIFLLFVYHQYFERPSLPNSKRVSVLGLAQPYLWVVIIIIYTWAPIFLADQWNKIIFLTPHREFLVHHTGYSWSSIWYFLITHQL